MVTYRSAKECDVFPYTSKYVCYIAISKDGEINQVGKRPADRKAALLDAQLGKIRLFCVWPGQWSSDLFEIDDLSLMEKAYSRV